jgi:uncharacterized membrane protein YfcA
MLDYLSSTSIALILLALGASIINGMVGYGFSSIVTPIALIWMTSRLLNPALVLVELGVNVALLVKEREHIPQTFPRAAPLMVGLLPGVIVGTFALSFIAPTNVKIIVYAALIPLILLQLLGLRRTIQKERHAGAVLGTGIGFLYSLTTISGPPLAIFWRNQGTSKGEFRCAMAQVRVAEASFTTVAYLAFGLFTPTSLGIVPLLLLPVLIGVPLGTLLLRSFSRDFFSKVVMGADGLFVSFGMTNVFAKIGLLTMAQSLMLFVAAALALVWLTYWAIQQIPEIRVAPEAEDLSFGAESLG